MDKEDWIKALNWFLLLEKGQVAVYDAQSKAVNSKYLSHAFKRFSDIETGLIKKNKQ